MWSDHIFEISDTVRSSIPLCVAVLLPLLIILSPAEAAVEFPAYRLQQFDLQGVKYGSRSFSFNFEARSIDTQSPSRKCILLSVNEFSPSRFQELVRDGIGTLLIVIPEDLQNIDQEVRENLLSIEKYLLSREIEIPVYFLQNSTQLHTIYHNIIDSTRKESSGSAFEAIMSALSSTGYQVAVYGSSTKLLQNLKITNLQGKLQVNSYDAQLPTIVVVAHYDSFGATSDLSFGADSNGSGVAALVELARLFSLLTGQTSQNSLPHYNLVFLLTGGGKINYLGSKKFLDDQLDSLDSSLLQDTHFVLCLDSIGADGELNIHVSKLPKNGSSIAQFVENLEKVASVMNDEVKVNLIHKKINLADDFLAWEHERYSIRRLTAMTASHFKQSKSETLRGSVLDTKASVDLNVLLRNVRLLAESLAMQLYKSQGPFFVDNLTPSKEVLSLWVDLLTNQSRSYPGIAEGGATIVSMLNQVFQSYLGDVKTSHLVADKRDPEFGFYDQTQATVMVYSVKPAIFDLFLTVAIAIYLSFVYFGIQGYTYVYSALLGCYQHLRPKMS